MAWRRLRWQAGSLFFPVATSRALERLWFTPPRGKPSAEGLRLLDTARTEWALVTGQGGSRRVRVYRWGSKGPIALLAHGWGGNAGQWHAVVKGLLAAGMRVVAFDALSHGASDAGAQGPQQTSALEMARSLLAVAWHVGPVHCVIAHSLGGAAAALAIREGLPVRGVVMIGSPADMHDACSALAWQLGIAPHILSRMQLRSEQWLGASWSSFNVPDVGRTRPVPPALIIHDRTDKEVRWEDGAAIAGAWPDAKLMTTNGLGHRRILRDEAVIGRIAAFVRNLGERPALPRAAAPCFGFGTRRRRDNRQSRQHLGKLNTDGADAAGAANNQHRFTGILTLRRDAQTIEQCFPRGNGGQRQRRSLGEIERRRLVASDALINQMEFAVGAGAGNAARIKHRIAHLEQRHFRTDRDHRACRIPAQHARRIFDLVLRCAHLGVHRVHGNGFHLDQQIVTGCFGLVDLDIDERLWIRNRKVLGQADGFHVGHPLATRQLINAMPAS